VRDGPFVAWPVPSPQAPVLYSKDAMAKLLIGTGLPADRAYHHAQSVENELANRQEPSAVTTERLFELAAKVLRAGEGEEAVVRLRRFRPFHELDLPLIVLVGGATGSGKSSVATEVAHRFGITRVTSTDFLRQTMRAFLSPEVVPSIHFSSFEAGRALTPPLSASADAVLLGFLEQTRSVLVAVKAVIERALAERLSMVLEGVHLVPGLLPPVLQDAVVVRCLLTTGTRTEHARRLRTRGTVPGGRGPIERYLRAMPDIRRIEDYLIARAKEHGVPVIENRTLEHTVDRVIELALLKADLLHGAAEAGSVATPPSERASELSSLLTAFGAPGKLVADETPARDASFRPLARVIPDVTEPGGPE
jgi:2-phosphoglycerate kinase